MIILPDSEPATSSRLPFSGDAHPSDSQVSLAALHLPLGFLAGLALAALMLSIRRSIAASGLFVSNHVAEKRPEAFASADLPSPSVSWELKAGAMMEPSFIPGLRPRPSLPRQYQSCPPVSMAKIIMVRHLLPDAALGIYPSLTQRTYMCGSASAPAPNALACHSSRSSASTCTVAGHFDAQDTLSAG
ncbi:hypothetical protein FB45DRAFT_1063375 [Roridomyces roridus]|uniref:Uncharacterized protein n=1 Tax=Roridomyces roridus TaxID=1738132 RepID=A0AAD7FFR7_9AGAR|nr:hypothetical protein FB45DRAFT_1063375 [Roridomyces roridus]